MTRAALTGGIATGKSYVLARIAQHGIPVIDADEIVHEAFAAGTRTTGAVAREFGGEVLRGDGSVDRAVLGSKVFAEPAARLRLEAIVHPFVYRRIRDWFTAVNAPLAVASIPLLFESGRERDFDVVIATVCERERQRQRLIDRGLSGPEAQRRIAAQLPADEKARRADHVIRTDGSYAETDAQLDDVIALLARRTDARPET